MGQVGSYALLILLDPFHAIFALNSLIIPQGVIPLVLCPLGVVAWIVSFILAIGRRGGASDGSSRVRIRAGVLRAMAGFVAVLVLPASVGATWFASLGTFATEYRIVQPISPDGCRVVVGVAKTYTGDTVADISVVYPKSHELRWVGSQYVESLESASTIQWSVSWDGESGVLHGSAQDTTISCPSQ